jgi:DNA-binding beta-propeller fold protein YncE
MHDGDRACSLAGHCRDLAGGRAGDPFGVVVTSSGLWSFVSLVNSIAVLRSGGQAARSLIRTIRLPGQGALGEARTRDGRYLLVAGDSGADVINVARAENGSPHAVLGSLASTGGGGAIEVALSADDRYAFVSLEGGQEIAVFSLQRALAQGFGRSDFVGDIPAGQAPVGLAVSPDGQWLYATSEFAASALPSGGGGLGSQSSLAVLNVAAALAGKPALLGYLRAGAFPRQMALEPGGRTLLVTNFNSSQLESVNVADLP